MNVLAMAASSPNDGTMQLLRLSMSDSRVKVSLLFRNRFVDEFLFQFERTV